MAQKYLGDYFDIHCGGEDHIPVHHTNEIAQTEARVGTRLANFWMHGYFLLSNDAKMAKSAGEFLRLKVLTDRGYDPLAYRYLCLTAHYRTQMNFTWDALDAATTALDRLRNGVYGLGCDRRTGRKLPRALRRRTQCRPQHAAGAWRSRGKCCAAICPRPRRKRRCSRSIASSGSVSQRGSRRPRRFRRRCRNSRRRVRPRARLRQLAEADRLRLALHELGWEMEDGADGYALKRR